MAGDTTDTHNEQTTSEAFNEEAFFNMPDDEFEKLQFADVPVQEEAAEPEEEETEGSDDSAASTDDEPEGEEEGTEGGESSGDEEHSEESEDDAGDESEESESDDDEESDSTTDSEDGVDYAAAGKELFAPFKANGKEIKVDSVEDARQLMQMGANYSKKMTALKPNLKHMKLLEDNKLLSDDKINYLIDIASGKPEAIKKLLRETKVDPMDLDLEEADTYQPSKRTVDDQRLQLDEVLENLQSSQHYDRLINTVGNDWDEDSKRAISKAPKVLEVLDSHMATGIYDSILGEVERERMLGRLDGMATLDAYRTVGDRMQAEGKFNHLGGNPGAQQAAKRSEQERAKKDREEQSRKSKKRAAASTRKAPSQSRPAADFNPLDMSDEEYEKLSSKYV